MPGLKVVAPATPADAKGLLTAAIRDDDPVIVLENLALYNTKGEVPDGEHVAEIGRAEVLRRAATSRSSATRGRRDRPGRRPQAGERRHLRRGDRPAKPPAAGPPDRLRLGPQDQPGRVVEDDWISYGIGAEIAATIAGRGTLDAPVRRVAAARCRCPTPSRSSSRPARHRGAHRVIRETLDGAGSPVGEAMPEVLTPGCRTPWQKEPSASGSSTKATRSQGRHPRGDRDRQGRHGHGSLRRGGTHQHPGRRGPVCPDQHPYRRDRRPGRRRNLGAAAGARPR